MELARQNILIQAAARRLRARRTRSPTPTSRPSTTSSRRQSSGTEYRARHILVEKEDEAKALIAQIKGGAKFEDLAKKNSKDPGSGENGGDLDFAAPERLRARVLAGDGQAEEGRDDRRRRSSRSSAITSSSSRTPATRSSRRSRKSSRRSSSAWRSRRSPRSATRSAPRRRPTTSSRTSRAPARGVERRSIRRRSRMRPQAGCASSPSDSIGA